MHWFFHVISMASQQSFAHSLMHLTTSMPFYFHTHSFWPLISYSRFLSKLAPGRGWALSGQIHWILSVPYLYMLWYIHILRRHLGYFLFFLFLAGFHHITYLILKCVYNISEDTWNQQILKCVSNIPEAVLHLYRSLSPLSPLPKALHLHRSNHLDPWSRPQDLWVLDLASSVHSRVTVRHLKVSYVTLIS